VKETNKRFESGLKNKINLDDLLLDEVMFSMKAQNLFSPPDRMLLAILE
jgi:hypothetical protein